MLSGPELSSAEEEGSARAGEALGRAGSPESPRRAGKVLCDPSHLSFQCEQSTEATLARF